MRTNVDQTARARAPAPARDHGGRRARVPRDRRRRNRRRPRRGRRERPRPPRSTSRLSGYRCAVKAGPHVVGVGLPAAIARAEHAEASAVPQLVRHLRRHGHSARRHVWPSRARSTSAGPGDTPSRRRIFACRPATAGRERRARGRSSTLAWRGAPTGGRRRRRREARSWTFYETGRADAAASRRASSWRCSASSRARVRASASSAIRGVAPGAVYRVSDLELASRLSFFLWSSIPDDELLTLASAGQAAGRRRCSSSRCGACWPTRAPRRWSTNFAGQWL